MGRELTARQILEKKKYTDCFLNGTTHSNQYGEGNHGVNAVPFFEEQNVKSTIDIGAGQGVFVNNLVNNGKLNLEKIYALDIASVSTDKNIKNANIEWIDGMAHNIPLSNNEVEWVVSFDCLEHCLPEDIDQILSEFYRVCTKGSIVKIAYRGCIEQSKIKETISVDQSSLHLTIHDENWWIDKFKEAKFKVKDDVKKIPQYLIFWK